MTLKQVATQLSNVGMNVKYRIRPDGGIVITEINGQKFSGRAGNVAARQMAGVQMTPAQQAQRSKISRTGVRSRVSGHHVKPLDADLKKALKRTQAAFRKYSTTAGKPTTKNVREYMRTHTKEETIQKLNRQIRYAKGLVYLDNIVSLYQRAWHDYEVYGSEAIRSGAESLWKSYQNDGQNATQVLFEEAKESLYEYEILMSRGDEGGAMTSAQDFKWIAGRME